MLFYQLMVNNLLKIFFLLFPKPNLRNLQFVDQKFCLKSFHLHSGKMKWTLMIQLWLRVQSSKVICHCMFGGDLPKVMKVWALIWRQMTASSLVNQARKSAFSQLMLSKRDIVAITHVLHRTKAAHRSSALILLLMVWNWFKNNQSTFKDSEFCNLYLIKNSYKTSNWITFMFKFFISSANDHSIQFRRRRTQPRWICFHCLFDHQRWFTHQNMVDI